MSLGIFKELQFFGLAVVRGVLILVLYDLLRIFRRVVPHGVLAVALEDVLYWAGTALLIFQLLYRENDGAVRGYALFAVAVGMLFYHQTVSGWLVENIAGVLNWCFGILLKPVRIIWKKVVQVFRIAVRFYKKKLKKRLKEFIIILFS
ncbi:MAG: spore cortex biosynthesis protein YabQ [Lachnospiraceae bacterium]|nr:spore cortex biosynthesis protein YabQ [Lachnospiraceae bacterium]